MNPLTPSLVPAIILPRSECCPKCGGRLSQSRMEHIILWRCSCGQYEAREVTGESRMAWAAAKDSLKIGRVW